MNQPVAFLALVGTASAAFAQPHWSDEFANGEFQYAMYDAGYALTVFDDGHGPALYMADIGYPSGASHVLRWDNDHWSALGAATWVFGSTYSLAAYDDGSGLALYAGGIGSPSGDLGFIARWNGVAWSNIGRATGDVRGIASFNDGSGPALFAVGSFTRIGNVPVARAARWNGSQWQPLGAGIGDGEPWRIAIFNDGTGAALYTGGQFTTAGGLPASNIARWDGSAWSALGAGVSGGNYPVRALATLDDGSGPALYAGGELTSAGGQPAALAARWNGHAWSPLGTALATPGGFVTSFAAYGQGPDRSIYAGSVFGGRLARFQGGDWSVVGGGTNGRVSALAPFDDGRGPALVIVGEFNYAGSFRSPRVAKWDGAQLRPLLLSGPDNAVGLLRVMDTPPGRQLHAWGAFDHIGSQVLPGRAVRSNNQWSPTPIVFPSHANDIQFSPAPDPVLYAAGAMIATPSGTAALARWDGAQWQSVISDEHLGLDRVLLVSDSSQFFAGNMPLPNYPYGVRIVGQHTDQGVVTFPADAFYTRISDLALFDTGQGPRLYVAGWNILARLDPPFLNTVDTVGPVPGSGGGIYPYAQSLVVFNDGSGPALYVGGIFRTAGPIAANNIAKWNGTSWAALGSGLGDTTSLVTVRQMIPFDDGSGPTLVVTGEFTTAGGLPASNIARWDGSRWSSFDGGVDAPVFTVAAFDDGSGPELWVGGFFRHAGSVNSGYIARWITSSQCYANCDRSTTPPVLNVDDFVCFLSRFVAGDTYANCDHSTTPPVLNVNDFTCFLNRFAAGCP